MPNRSKSCILKTLFEYATDPFRSMALSREDSIVRKHFINHIACHIKVWTAMIASVLKNARNNVYRVGMIKPALRLKQSPLPRPSAPLFFPYIVPKVNLAASAQCTAHVSVVSRETCRRSVDKALDLRGYIIWMPGLYCSQL
jgi:hypothetical protein